MIWIIGTGSIALEYAKILKSLKQKYLVIGRSGKKNDEFLAIGAKEVIKGGIDNYLSSRPKMPIKVIVATNLEQLSVVTLSLLNYGIKDIMVEKPGFCSPLELNPVVELIKKNNANVLIAYNRRFFSSVFAVEKIIKEDGGLRSFCFEFTEWGHVIEKLNHDSRVLENWFYANSTHVIDLAFFLGGIPKQISSYTSGELSWHTPAIFAGAGVTDKNALFSYQANWNAPGRWAVELLTDNHRLYLKPMEVLNIQEKGSIVVELVQVDNHLDVEFKPGFYLQTKAFIDGDFSRFCSIEEQYNHLKFYSEINKRYV